MTAQSTIIIRKKKKGGHGAHHGGSWKIAYADFVTAMMAFFLLLWLLSSPDKARLEGLAAYFSATPSAVEATAGANGVMGGESAGKSGSAQSGSPVQATKTEEIKAEDTKDKSEQNGKGEADRPDATLRVLAEELRISFQEVASKSKTTNQTSVKEDRKGLRISLVDSEQRPMFRAGTAELYPYAKDALKLIAQRIMKGSFRVAIEGHTDGIGGKSEANWRLSGDRAQAARRVLVEAGFGEDRVAEVAALAGNEPAYPNDPNRAENRRIVVVVLSEPAAYPADVSFKR